MTQEITTPTTKKRRTPQELKAFHLSKVKEAEEREKAQVCGLFLEALGALAEASTLEASKPHASSIAAAQNALKFAMAALAPKP